MSLGTVNFGPKAIPGAGSMVRNVDFENHWQAKHKTLLSGSVFDSTPECSKRPLDVPMCQF